MTEERTYKCPRTGNNVYLDPSGIISCDHALGDTSCHLPGARINSCLIKIDADLKEETQRRQNQSRLAQLV